MCISIKKLLYRGFDQTNNKIIFVFCINYELSEVSVLMRDYVIVVRANKTIFASWFNHSDLPINSSSQLTDQILGGKYFLALSELYKSPRVSNIDRLRLNWVRADVIFLRLSIRSSFLKKMLFIITDCEQCGSFENVNLLTRIIHCIASKCLFCSVEPIYCLYWRLFGSSIGKVTRPSTKVPVYALWLHFFR